MTRVYCSIVWSQYLDRFFPSGYLIGLDRSLHIADNTSYNLKLSAYLVKAVPRAEVSAKFFNEKKLALHRE